MNSEPQMNTTATEEKKSASKIDLLFVDNSSKKRKRNQLKGPAGYGLKMQAKKRKIDEKAGDN